MTQLWSFGKICVQFMSQRVTIFLKHQERVSCGSPTVEEVLVVQEISLSQSWV